LPLEDTTIITMTQLYIVRHGETEWSREGRYTSVTDIGLISEGRNQAKSLGRRLNPEEFGLVLTSPKIRARQTAEIAGFASAEVDQDLDEWFYGDLEGQTIKQIRDFKPGWQIWTSSVPGGEQRFSVAARAARLVNRIRQSEVDKAICFSHGHLLRAIALSWIGVEIMHGGSLPLNAGSVSILGYDDRNPAILAWNT